MDRQLNLRYLRRRMGWTSSDLARRLGVAATEIEIWESGKQELQDPDVLNRIEFLFRQADMCCEEVKTVPISEIALEDGGLGQIDSSRVKDRAAN